MTRQSKITLIFDATVVGPIVNRLRDACGYELIVQAGLDIPAKVMFNAYFEEKGVPFRLP